MAIKLATPPAGSLAGYTIGTNCTVNPRRPGVFGWHAMQALIAAGPAGMPYAAYCKAGGASNHAKWDFARGNAWLVAPVAAPLATPAPVAAPVAATPAKPAPVAKPAPATQKGKHGVTLAKVAVTA